MSEQIDVKEAVRRSIMTEKNAMDFYLRCAARANNAGARRVFELLAGEEREHVGWFFNIYTGEDLDDLESFLKTAPSSDSDWLRDLEKIGGDVLNERKAMELALDKERKLADHLRGMAAKMTDPAVRQVFEDNARSTDNHYQLIESEYARLMGMVHESDIDTFVRE